MLKKKNETKSFADEVGDVVAAVSEVVRTGSAQALEASGPYLEKANAAVKAGTEAAAPVLHEASERLKKTADQVRPQVDKLSQASKDQFDSAKKKFDEDIAPQVTEKAGAVASQATGLLATVETPKQVEDLVIKVTGDKKAVKKAQKKLAKASKDIALKTRPKPKKGKGLVWVLVLGGLAGVAYFVWKKAQPVEDPWSTPLPGNRPADARPVGSTPASQATTPTVSKVAAPAEGEESEDETSAKH